jgi:hypothetical protein
MATKKTAAPKQELASWDEELARLAALGSASAGSLAGTSKSIKTRGGNFTIDGNDAGRTLRAVVLEHVLENAYYGGEKFDPENPKNPVSFAIGKPGQEAKDLVWHEDSLPEHAGTLCKDTDINQWGSADTGRGKATKNLVRLMLIAADDLDDIEGAEARMLKVPVTSGKNWAGYVQQIKAAKGWPTLGVVTDITLKPHPKYQFEMNFKLVEDVDGALIGALMAKREATLDDLTRPYSPQAEEEEAPPAKGGGKALAKTASKASGTKQAAPAGRRR